MAVTAPAPHSQPVRRAALPFLTSATTQVLPLVDASIIAALLTNPVCMFVAPRVQAVGEMISSPVVLVASSVVRCRVARVRIGRCRWVLLYCTCVRY